MPRHFTGQHNFINKNESFDDFSDRLIRGVEDDARMIYRAAGKAKEILIARDDDSAFIARETEMGLIILGSQPCLDCSCYIDSRAAQSGGYGRIDVFVKVETDSVSHGREPATFLAGVRDCSS